MMKITALSCCCVRDLGYLANAPCIKLKEDRSNSVLTQPHLAGGTKNNPIITLIIEFHTELCL